MIVLGTNVMSEAMKPAPAPSVRAWLDDQLAKTLHLSGVTVAELLFRISAPPAGNLQPAPARAWSDRVRPTQLKSSSLKIQLLARKLI